MPCGRRGWELLVQLQWERIEQRERAFDVRFGPGVLAHPSAVDSIENETGGPVVNGGSCRILAVEPRARTAREAFVSGFSSGGSHGIEAAHDATDIERENSGARKLLFNRRNQCGLRTAAGCFDQVGALESCASLGERRLLQVPPEVDPGLPDLVW